MSQRMKIGGEWKALDVFLKVKGEWKQSTAVYVKVGGEWKIGRHIHTLVYESNDLETHTATCAHCGEKITEGHVYALVGGTGATCTESGTEIYLCNKCNQQKTVVIEALGHSWNTEVINAPTCTEEGEQKETCTRCGEFLFDPIPAAGHAYGDPDYVAATCTEFEGNLYRCLNCDHTWFDMLGDALGHNYLPSYEDMPDGTIVCTWTCTRCGDSYAET